MASEEVERGDEILIIFCKRRQPDRLDLEQEKNRGVSKYISTIILNASIVKFLRDALGTVRNGRGTNVCSYPNGDLWFVHFIYGTVCYYSCAQFWLDISINGDL